MQAPRARWPHVLFALYCALALGAVTWPGYTWYGNRIRPLVLGLPLSLAWLVGWVVATFVALALYEFAHEREGK
jgi:TRAP-type C4-dicarboxylate transport system permease small subunit